MNHTRTYSAALVVLGVFTTLSAGLLLYLTAISAEGAVNALLPDWSLAWVAIANLAYALAIFATLYARRFRPETGRELTRVLNWALLPAVPGGTVVGLYGLLVANREKGIRDPTAYH